MVRGADYIEFGGTWKVFLGWGGAESVTQGCATPQPPSICSFKSQWKDVKSRVFVVLFVSRKGSWPLTSEIHPYICPFIYRIPHRSSKPFSRETIQVWRGGRQLSSHVFERYTITFYYVGFIISCSAEVEEILTSIYYSPFL